MVGVLIYSQQGLSRKVPTESFIGIGYLIGAALTVIFIARTPRGLILGGLVAGQNPWGAPVRCRPPGFAARV